MKEAYLFRFCFEYDRLCTMPPVPEGWKRFLASLRFDERLEFNEGDIGLAGTRPTERWKLGWPHQKIQKASVNAEATASES